MPPREALPISDTVEQVLRLAVQPMKVNAIYQACEHLLDRSISYRSLRTCLWKGSQPDGRFVRLGYGMYRLREPAEAE